MTHQYRAEDFADLPKKALEALGVTLKDVSFPVNDTVFDLTEVHARGIGKFTATPTNAAALLIGLVQQRCDYFTVMLADDGYECCINRTEGTKGLVGVVRTSSLSAVLSAYAAALGQQQEARP